MYQGGLPVCRQSPIKGCCALINQRLEILGSHYLDYEDFALLRWKSLLRLAKASKRF